jgi:vacuolar-type H+-ATPase subunit E/Vma4
MKMTTNQNSTEKLHEEIFAEAQRESEEIIIHARQDAEIFLTSAGAVADRTRQERLDHARAEATLRSSLIRATIPVETGRLRTLRVETLLESVREEALRRLLTREGFEYRETVIVLAADAIRQMTGDIFTVKLSSSDQDILGDGLSEEITLRVGRAVNITVSLEPDMTGSGVMVEDSEGRQVWDNRLLKRLERLWPELRRQIAIEAALVLKRGLGGDSL